MTLEEWMTKHEISGSELARRVGVTKGAISRLRNGLTQSSRLAERIALVSGDELTPADILWPNVKGLYES